MNPTQDNQPDTTDNHPGEEQLQAYLDRALDPGSASRIAAHLQDCRGCKTDFELLESTVLSLESLTELSLEQDLSRSVLNRLSSESESYPGWIWIAAVEAAAAVLILFFSAPRLQRLIRELSWQDLGRSGLARAAAYTARLSAGWQSWWNDLTDLARISIPNPGSSFLPEPTTAFWLILAFGLAAGLAANTLLLRHRNAAGKN